MTSSQSSSTSSNSSWFELGDWDQPWNGVDTLGLQILPQKSKLEKSIMSKFSFDKHNEFSDVQLFTLQNSGRFFNLLDLLKFPRQPLQSSIFCCFYTKSYRCKPQRFLQREAFQLQKQWNLAISPKWWWPPPTPCPPSGVGTFLNLGLYWNGLTPLPPPKINLGLFLTWDFFETEWPPKNSLKQVEYEKYWYKINQYEWYNGIFGHV